MKVFPVVHIHEESVAKDQAMIAIEEGADGVYLIDNHSHTPSRLFRVVKLLNQVYPRPFIGINILGLRPSQQLDWCGSALDAGAISKAPGAVWSDLMDLDDDAAILKGTDRRLRNVITLGAASFKDQDETEDPEISAESAMRAAVFSDIVVTSGSGTGIPPSKEKVDAMKDAVSTLNGKELAVASGVSPDNVSSLSSADQVLVASSIETFKGSGVFDADELKRMIETAHSL
jgi:predicted TIM-barrel enzyme